MSETDPEQLALDFVPTDVRDLTGDPVESDVEFNPDNFRDDDTDDVEAEDD